MKKTSIVMVVTAGLFGTAFVSPAGAANTIYAGANCSFYSGTASSNTVLTRSGGDGWIRNISSSSTKAQCTVAHNALSDSTIAWSMLTDTATGWTSSSCTPIWYDDLAQNFALYPTSMVKSSTPGPSRNKFNGDTAVTFGLTNGPMVLGCVMPPDSTLIAFNINEN